MDNVDDWKYIQGDPDGVINAKISPDGKYILLKEYEQFKGGHKQYYRLIDLEHNNEIRKRESEWDL